MAQTTTQIQIVNRGLQLLGAKSISTINDNSREARAMNRAYQPVLLAELRSNCWRFSIKRAQLPAAAVKPIFGPANYFPIPGDYLMIAPADVNINISPFGSGFMGRDWQIENTGNGLAIASNDTPPINLRYVSSALTESQFDVDFAEALSASLAMNTCEEITQSNAKYQNAEKAYDAAIAQARKRNSFEMHPAIAPVDSWHLARF